LADDYIKQLQLSKQIEQKAKEAAKSRKTAEDKLEEAEKAIELMRSFGAQSSEAEKHFVEAREAFKGKDYKLVLSHSTHTIETCNQTCRDRIEEVLRSAHSLLDLGKDRITVPAQMRNMMASAKEDAEQGRFEHGFNTAKELYEKADQLVNRTVAEAFGEAQSKALFLEGLKVDIDSERSQLGRARRALEEGRYKESLQETDRCLASLDNLTKEQFRSGYDSLKEQEGFAFDEHFDLSRVKEKMEAAQNRMESQDYEEAFADLASADTELRRALGKGMNAYIATAKRRSVPLKDLGVDVSMVLALITEAKDQVKEEDFRAANGTLAKLRDLLTDLERKQLAKSLARMKSRLLIAKKVKADLTGTLGLVEEARLAQEKGDMPLAVQKVEESDRELNRALAGYQEVEAELVEFRSVSERARTLGLNIDDATRTVALARRAALRQDFASAASLLRDSKRDVQTAIQEHYGKMVIRIELDLGLAMRIGADVSSDSSTLDALVQKVKQNEFGIVEAELKELAQDIKQKIDRRAQHVLIQARKAIDTYKGPLDVTEAKALLASADEELRKGNFVSAHDLAQSAVETLKKEELLQVEGRIDEAERILAIMKEMECESNTLKEKFRRAVELRQQRMFGESARLATEVVQFGSSIIKDELSRQMAKVGKAINISRKKGVEVSAPEHFIEGAWRALNADRMDEAFGLMNDSMEELRRMNQLHTEVYDQIADVRALLQQAEAKNLPVGNAAATLEGAQDLFEEGRYAEARDMSQKAYLEVERGASVLIAPKMLGEAESLVEIVGKVRSDNAKLAKDLAQAKELERAGKHLEAITAAKNVRNGAQSEVMAALQHEIDTSRSTIRRSQADGMDMVSAEMMVSKAETLLNEGLYNDAWRALELARSELDQSVFMEQKAKDLLHQTELEIREVEELGLDIGPAMEVLQKAYFLQRAGNHALALELGKKAEQIACSSAERMVKDRLSALEGQYQLGTLSGPDYIPSAKRKEDVMSLLAQKRYKESIILLGPYELDLMELRRNREQAQMRMRQLEQRLQTAQAAGRVSEYGRQMALRAQERLNEGAYSESLMLMARCEEDQQNLEEMYSSREKELASLREDLEYVQDQGRKRSTAQLLEQAGAALRKLDFERSSLFLRRGRAALMEATGHEVGQYFEELMALTRLMEREGIEVPSGTVNGGNGQFTKMNEIRPKDLERLRAEVGEFRRIVTVRFRERMRQVSEKVGRAGADGLEVSASMKLLTHAEELNRNGKMEEAFATLDASERLQGVTWTDYQEFNKLREDVMRKCAAIKLAGGDVAEAERLLNGSEHEMLKDSANALHQVRAVRTELDRRMADMVPDIGVDIDFLEDPKAGKWTKAVMRVSNQGTGPAKSVSVQLKGPIEIRGGRFLPLVAPGKTERFGVELCPRNSGKLVITLVLEARSQLTDEDCGYEGEFEMKVN
jgi:hypothetical protein